MFLLQIEGFGTRPRSIRVPNIFRNAHRTALWIGCACIGTYIAYRYWRQRELRLTDEGFEDVTKFDLTEDKRIVVLGPEGAGKTSIIQQLCVANHDVCSYSVPAPPTQGSSIYRLVNGSNIYYIWDIGGTNPTKKYWGAFLQDANLMVFVVDASDIKLSEAVLTLKELLGDSRIGTVPILVLANKQDLPGALPSEAVGKILDLLSIPPHKHKVEVLSCQTRPILEESFGKSDHVWYHESIDAVRHKIFAMAT